ncbi:MAG TPA: xylose isomerase, partial [Streptomyces sp.]|nr:xylose isomerase [Streptomyces sp.]
MKNDSELAQTLRRRRFLGVAAGTTAAALLGAAATGTPAVAAPAEAAGKAGGAPLLPPGRLGMQLYS